MLGHLSTKSHHLPLEMKRLCHYRLYLQSRASPNDTRKSLKQRNKKWQLQAFRWETGSSKKCLQLQLWGNERSQGRALLVPAMMCP